MPLSSQLGSYSKSVDAKATWSPDQYLRFEQERTRPCRELINRIGINPRTIIDLGCGPGNSTAVLATRWPEAEITGLDNSDTMLAAAHATGTRITWTHGDIAAWAAGSGPQFDLVFSNAALQWVGDHSAVFPALMRRVADGGVLAVQVPSNVNAPAHRIMREHFPGGPVREWFVHEPAFYYDVLAGHARNPDLWTTEYLHVMPDVDAIAEWYRGTGLRPFLNALATDEERQEFVQHYICGLKAEFPPRRDGKVLFPFQRLFLIAEK